ALAARLCLATESRGSLACSAVPGESVGPTSLGRAIPDSPLAQFSSPTYTNLFSRLGPCAGARGAWEAKIAFFRNRGGSVTASARIPFLMVNRNLLRQFDLSEDDLQSELAAAFNVPTYDANHYWLPAEEAEYTVNKIVEGRVLNLVG